MANETVVEPEIKSLEVKSPEVKSPEVNVVQGKFCSSCGSQIHEKAVICPKCGVPVKNISSGDPKNKTTAALLALFLGGIGIHKLYLKRSNWWLYLLFCWTFIPAIIAFVEAIQLFMMADSAFDAQYNQ